MERAQSRAKIAGVFAFICLVDAANCVRLGHDDWILPASLALVSALMIRKPPRP